MLTSSFFSSEDCFSLNVVYFAGNAVCDWPDYMKEGGFTPGPQTVMNNICIQSSFFVQRFCFDRVLQQALLRSGTNLLLTAAPGQLVFMLTLAIIRSMRVALQMALS